MEPEKGGSTQFKLGDLGVAKMVSEVASVQTRGWMLPPELIDPAFGPADHRIDIYHTGLLLLQLALSKVMQFTPDEIRDAKPRALALTLPGPFNFALEKALRRHAPLRTQNAKELWRDLNSPVASEGPAISAAPQPQAQQEKPEPDATS
jgi:serine/threonine protein kinase